MEPFTRLHAVAAPMEGTDIDTDRIIPARFLRKPRATGYGGFLFHDVRFHPDGSEREDFVLNQPGLRGARILVVDENFGCGSSREGAVWALVDSGIRAVVAPSFGDIFYNNSFKNGLLPVRLSHEAAAGIRAMLRERPGSEMSVDLEAQAVTDPSGAVHGFDVDEFRKACLRNGWDDVDLTRQHDAELDAFVAGRRREVPWIFDPAPEP